MNKLLATTLSCLSVASHADIYVCESKISEEIVAPNVLKGNYLTKDIKKYFVADSETGVRESNGNKHINEPCQISDEFLICMSIYDGVGVNSFAIDTKNYTFTYVEQNYRTRISSYYGICIKGS
tara:strand:- start:1351 stop:1722 length:372 start_codon:yes stop_codon:yes gene_type:complete